MVFPWKILWKRLNFFFWLLHKRRRRVIPSYSGNSFTQWQLSLHKQFRHCGWFVELSTNMIYSIWKGKFSVQKIRVTDRSERSQILDLQSEKKPPPYSHPPPVHIAGMGIKGGKDSGLIWFTSPCHLLLQPHTHAVYCLKFDYSVKITCGINSITTYLHVCVATARCSVIQDPRCRGTVAVHLMLMM